MTARFFLFCTFLCFCSTALRTQSCDCGAAFAYIKEKTERNYAGFSEKVTTQTRDEYNLHTEQYGFRCDSLSETKACFLACRTWLSWFKDRHLNLLPDTLERPRRPDSDFALTLLDSQTLLFKFPSMDFRNSQSVQERVQQHRALLERTPYLILDCRDNLGGQSATWYPWKKYLQTGATVMDGSLMWASEDNAQFLLKSSEKAPKAVRKRMKAYAKEMKKHPGRFVGSMNSVREQYGPPAPYPQKVVILTNHRSAGTCETFILWAQQSKKVTVMGEQTAGVVDYTTLFKGVVPCLNWAFFYPTSRSNRVADGRGLDNIGIPPDVRLDEKASDWIAFAQQWLQKK